MTKLIVMVGVPGSGKSTYAKQHFDETAEILSGDALRKELLGDETNQSHKKIVFAELYKRARAFLISGKDVVIDGTNINVFERARIFKNFEDLNLEKIAIVMNTSLEKCYKQNELRIRKVEADVIEMYSKKFEMPTTNEGFDKIIIVSEN